MDGGERWCGRVAETVKIIAQLPLPVPCLSMFASSFILVHSASDYCHSCPKYPPSLQLNATNKNRYGLPLIFLLHFLELRNISQAIGMIWNSNTNDLSAQVSVTPCQKCEEQHPRDYNRKQCAKEQVHISVRLLNSGYRDPCYLLPLLPRGQYGP